MLFDHGCKPVSGKFSIVIALVFYPLHIRVRHIHGIINATRSCFREFLYEQLGNSILPFCAVFTIFSGFKIFKFEYVDIKFPEGWLVLLDINKISIERKFVH